MQAIQTKDFQIDVGVAREVKKNIGIGMVVASYLEYFLNNPKLSKKR